MRTPTRIDKDIFLPPLVAGGPDFVSEELMAYEIGYRGRPVSNGSLSVSLFYNDYDRLRSVGLSPDGMLPVTVQNSVEGQSYGAEIWGEYDILPWWRLKAGFNYLERDFQVKFGQIDLTNLQTPGNDARFQASIWSQMELTERLELDVRLRTIDDLPLPAVAGYTEADMRLGWRFSDHLSLAVTGSNLLHEKHQEGTSDGSLNEARRGVSLQLTWRD